jgi:Fe-S cluster assembly ATP-binding protein
MSILNIKKLHVNVDGKPILNGVDLEVKSGEVHAIMGPNGTGKSTLASALMGNPKFEVISGSVTMENQDLLEMEVDERARAGLFLAMQYPAEVPGVTNSDFMRQALRAVSENAIKDLKMKENMAHRYLNEGFSGGERKRNEILQLKILKPKIAILDEIDSGLDVDALKIVGKNVSEMINSNFGCILITHYQRILKYIKPTHVHIMIDGKIALSGGEELIEKIDKNGYEWIPNSSELKNGK